MLRVGIAGLGRVSRQIIRGFAAVEGVALAAAADLRPEAREQFAAEHRLPVFATVEAMCRSPLVDAIWVGTPNPLHCAHAVAAAEAGKHVICEKPMALSLEECDRIIAAAERSGVRILLVSKIFDPPVRAMREIILSGRLGRVVQINSMMFSDWLERPRLAEEVDTSRGGGIVFRQAPHIVDINRYLAGGLATSVRAVTGKWDPRFDTEGNFAALLAFDGGAVANVSISGYGYFDGSELTWGIGEGGNQASQAQLRRRRDRATGPLDPTMKYAGAAAEKGSGEAAPQQFQPFYGLTIVSCERGVIRQSPDGLTIYSATGCEEIPVAQARRCAPELAELRDAVAQDRDVFPDGRWGKATLEVCLAIVASASEHREMPLTQQVAAPEV
ncbi:MAG: pht2 [Rhodospirillales bacterium]|nr:pht2 [Rhodospirillales bacterium]